MVPGTFDIQLEYLLPHRYYCCTQLLGAPCGTRWHADDVQIKELRFKSVNLCYSGYVATHLPLYEMWSNLMHRTWHSLHTPVCWIQTTDGGAPRAPLLTRARVRSLQRVWHAASTPDAWYQYSFITRKALRILFEIRLFFVNTNGMYDTYISIHVDSSGPTYLHDCTETERSYYTSYVSTTAAVYISQRYSWLTADILIFHIFMGTTAVRSTYQVHMYTLRDTKYINFEVWCCIQQGCFYCYSNLLQQTITILL